MRYKTTLAVMALTGALAWAAACSSDAPSAPSVPAIPADVQALHTALDPFTSLALAKAAGYTTAITDCMSNGDEGAMGIHFGDTHRFDAVVEANHPEVLIYEPGTNGEMSLVGVEFLVPYAAVPKTAAAPELFGQRFTQNDVFGVWALHVWTHRANPSGLFAPWNPRVHC